jgi:hypothetical protein
VHTGGRAQLWPRHRNELGYLVHAETCVNPVRYRIAVISAGTDDRLCRPYEGATALSTSIGGTQSFDYAGPVATTLIEQAIGVSLPVRTGQA